MAKGARVRSWREGVGSWGGTSGFSAAQAFVRATSWAHLASELLSEPLAPQALEHQDLAPTAKKAETGAIVRMVQRLTGVHGADPLPSHDKLRFLEMMQERWAVMGKPTLEKPGEKGFDWAKVGWYVLLEDSRQAGRFTKVKCSLTGEDGSGASNHASLAGARGWSVSGNLC